VPHPAAVPGHRVMVRDAATHLATTWYGWLAAESADVVGFRADRRDWLVVLPWDRLGAGLALAREGSSCS
jgi:hypothetical protein